MPVGHFSRYFRTRYVATLVALVAFGLVGPALAQTAPQPSPAAILAAKQILDIKNIQDVFRPIIRGVVIKARDTFLQTNFMWQRDLDEISVNFEKQYDPRVSELVDAAARIYASHFTEQELRDMLAFYQSPLGRKMVAEEPKVLDESMINAGKWADNFSQEVMAGMRAEMKKRGKDM